MPLAASAGSAQSTPAPATDLASPKTGCASSSKPKHAKRRSQIRLAGSTSRLIAIGSVSTTARSFDDASSALLDKDCPAWGAELTAALGWELVSPTLAGSSAIWSTGG